MDEQQEAGTTEDIAERGLRYTKEQWEQLMAQTEDYVRENPTRAVAYALVAGLVLCAYRIAAAELHVIEGDREHPLKIFRRAQTDQPAEGPLRIGCRCVEQDACHWAAVLCRAAHVESLADRRGRIAGLECEGDDQRVGKAV